MERELHGRVVVDCLLTANSCCYTDSHVQGEQVHAGCALSLPDWYVVVDHYLITFALIKQRNPNWQIDDDYGSARGVGILGSAPPS